MKLLLGFWGKSVQLLQWIISLMTGSSGCTGGGGTRLIPAIMGLMGAIIPKLGSKLWIQMESGRKKNPTKQRVRNASINFRQLEENDQNNLTNVKSRTR